MNLRENRMTSWIRSRLVRNAPGPVAVRFHENPIITTEMLPPGHGDNINGPSLIQVPSWIADPLGKYYLYFAHHKGTYIRMAYADTLSGPWKVHAPGTLALHQCIGHQLPEQGLRERAHIASPDVLVDPATRTVVMYFHTLVYTGSDPQNARSYQQKTVRAVSPDGVNFTSEDQLLGPPYFRVFRWQEDYYALTRLGRLFRSQNGATPFTEGQNPFRGVRHAQRIRHLAVQVKDDKLVVCFSQFGDKPESIFCSDIQLSENWALWKASSPRLVLKPEMSYEGANLPLIASKQGMSTGPCRQLRDPAIFTEDDNRTFLLYTVAGEMGIAIAELTEPVHARSS